jgi:hypothetical protein
MSMFPQPHGLPCRAEAPWNILPSFAPGRTPVNPDYPFNLNGALQITGGRYFWPLEPEHPGNDNCLDIETIGHLLSTKVRWNGVMSDKHGDPLSYSVAQHSVIVADLAQMARRKLVPSVDWDNEASPALYGLLHDADEGFLVDMPRPLKVLPAMDGYVAAQNALMDRILREFNVPYSQSIYQCVKIVDDAMIFLERDALVGRPVASYGNEAQHPLRNLYEVVPDFYPWDARTAKRRFIEKYEEIVANDGNLTPLAYRDRGYGL